MTANWPIPYAKVGSRRTAACVTLGATSLSSSNHFPHRLYSNIIKPVALAPGCDRLSTKPDPTGSGTMTSTMGMVLVAFIIASVAAPPPVTNTSRVPRHTFVSQLQRLQPSVARAAHCALASNPNAQTLPKMPRSVLERLACLLILPLGRRHDPGPHVAVCARQAATLPPCRREL